MKQPAKTKIQSVILFKDKFTLDHAKKWIKDHDFKLTFYGKGVDETEDSYRFRQMSPKRFKRYRTLSYREKDGVSFVLGIE